MKIRAVSIFTIITLFFGLSSWRVYDIGHSTDLTAASSQMTYVLTVNEPRGNIYDRNMRKLVGTQSKYVAAISPNVSTVNEINNKLGDAAKGALKILRSGKPAAIDATADFSSEQSFLFSVPVRYAEHQIASHIIGYADASGHGITGLEYAYDELLTADDPVTVTYTVDATGRPLSGVDPIVSGTTDVKTGVVLTLDSAVQKAVEQVAPNLGTGAVIVMNAADGDILAMCSVPNYSPLNIAASLENSSSPLLNRALMAYNVGSVFKISVAAAAIDNGTSASWHYNCTGSTKIGTNVFNCHEYGGHGNINMTQALSGSCNPYFISLAQRTGADKILELCKNLGFGSSRNLANGLSAVAGTLPSVDKLTTLPAALANFSFGQGELLLNSVDIAVMTAMIANGGYAVTPRIVSGVVLADGSLTEYRATKPKRVIKDSTADTVSQMMCAVVSDGTGAAALPEVGGAGGKTATAEAGYKIDGKKVNQCWFTGFYPADNPQYVITVLGENGATGSTTCAPVFKQICDSLYDLGV